MKGDATEKQTARHCDATWPTTVTDQSAEEEGKITEAVASGGAADSSTDAAEDGESGEAEVEREAAEPCSQRSRGASVTSEVAGGLDAVDAGTAIARVRSETPIGGDETQRSGGGRAALARRRDEMMKEVVGADSWLYARIRSADLRRTAPLTSKHSASGTRAAADLEQLRAAVQQLQSAGQQSAEPSAADVGPLAVS